MATWARTIASAPCKHERRVWATTEANSGTGPRSLPATGSPLCYRDADDSEVPKEEEGGRATRRNVPSPTPPARTCQDSPSSTNKELDEQEQDGEGLQEVIPRARKTSMLEAPGRRADANRAVLLMPTSQSFMAETAGSCYVPKTANRGISESRIEKRIVISGDTGMDRDQEA